MADTAKLAALAHAIVSANMTSLAPSPVIEQAAKDILAECGDAEGEAAAADDGEDAGKDAVKRPRKSGAP